MHINMICLHLMRQNQGNGVLWCSGDVPLPLASMREPDFRLTSPGWCVGKHGWWWWWMYEWVPDVNERPYPFPHQWGQSGAWRGSCSWSLPETPAPSDCPHQPQPAPRLAGVHIKHSANVHNDNSDNNDDDDHKDDGDEENNDYDHMLMVISIIAEVNSNTDNNSINNDSNALQLWIS